MDNCNGFPTLTKVEATIGIDANGYEAHIEIRPIHMLLL